LAWVVPEDFCIGSIHSDDDGDDGDDDNGIFS
jgi:hypothetical protein